MTYWNDLLVLQDISEELEKSIVEEVNFDDNDIDDFKESVLYFIEDWINSNIKLYKEYKFEEIMYESIYDIILDNYGFMVDELSFDLESNIFDAMEIYFYKNDCFRSYSGTTIVKSPNKKKIKKLLKKWENVEQPEQLTEAWFKFRKEGLSASDIWKAVGSQSAKNSLIYSKCKPIDMQKTQSVNITSPFHNGHKYEPLSIMHYEYDFNTKVGEFGCKAHSEYPFLRASPDGINIGDFIQDPRDMFLLCQTASLPGKRILTTEAAHNHHMAKKPYSAATDEVSMTFLLTNDYYIKKYFDVWQEMIIDTSREHYKAFYKNEYCTDILIQQLSQSNDMVPGYTIKLENAYPISISSVELDEGSEGLMSMGVTWEYDNYKSVGLIDGFEDVANKMLQIGANTIDTFKRII